ncbi:MAG: glycosyltransferase family A protein [Saprospiraceae bacterium]
MQEFRKFTVLIPTKNRCETLHWAMKTCLQSTYPALSLIVSDNCSTDNTFAVVSSFNDSRVKYYCTPQALSMTANWEFALSKVEDGFVTILGDDDGFLPDSFEKINLLLDQYQVKAISWKQSFFRWPGNNYVRIPELMSIPLKQGVEIRHSRDFLPKVMRCQKFPGDLPWLYSGFVDVSIIKSIKEKGRGRFFNSKIPDIYSSMVLASEIDSYLFSYTPLSIAGHSAKSNGAAQIQNKPEFEERKNLFNKESEDIPFHTALEFVHVYPIIIWETYLQSIDAGVQKFLGLAYGPLLMKLAIKDAITLGFLENERGKLESIARKNGLSLHISDNKTIGLIQKFLLRLKSYFVEWTSAIFINLKDFNISNVYDASIMHQKIHKKYNHRLKAIIHNFVLLLKQAL